MTPDHTEADTPIERFFVIADLAGYTALTEAMGPREAARIVKRYVALAQHALASGADLVEGVGDEVLIVTENPVSAVETALALQSMIAAEPLFPDVRAGIHGGLVIEREGHYFGAALNLTARVAAHARAGQTLCTERIADAINLPGVDCRPLGVVKFRYVVEAVAIFEITKASELAGAPVIDPVCRMHIRPDLAPARLPFGSVIFYFCSYECARRFTERPDDYASP